MNCKAGDLAMVVRRGGEQLQAYCAATGSNVDCDLDGYVVKVLKFVGPVTWSEITDYWEIEPIVYYDLCLRIASDSILRPIDNPAEDAVDEMVRMKGKPHVTLNQAVEHLNNLRSARQRQLERGDKINGGE